jgi:hypothetical protein
LGEEQPLRGEPYSQFLTPSPDFSSSEHLEDEPPSKIEGRKESARLANPNIFKNLLRLSITILCLFGCEPIGQRIQPIERVLSATSA